jgi:hypothetical protein
MNNHWSAHRSRCSVHATIQAPRPGPHAAHARTIFDTPVVNTLLRAASAAFLRSMAGRSKAQLPARPQERADRRAAHQQLGPALHADGGLLPAAEHLLDGQGQPVPWPAGPADALAGRHCGGPQQEQQPGGGLGPGLVQSTGPVQLVVPPEGTRGRTRHWKTGFYFIALQAQVPIVLAYMDYQRKVSGLGPVFTPTGDVDTRHGRDQAVLRRHQGQARRSV